MNPHALPSGPFFARGRAYSAYKRSGVSRFVRGRQSLEIGGNALHSNDLFAQGLPSFYSVTWHLSVNLIDSRVHLSCKINAQYRLNGCFSRGSLGKSLTLKIGTPFAQQSRVNIRVDNGSSAIIYSRGCPGEENDRMEKRKAERISHLTEVKCEGDGIRRLNSRITDLSAGGAFIDSVVSPPAGSEIQLSFRVGGTAITTPARVCYCLAAVGFGVSFIGLSGQHRAILEGLILYKELAELRSEEWSHEVTVWAGVEELAGVQDSARNFQRP